jgi:RimJ/RimL family protein N-acetyltransferase
MKIIETERLILRTWQEEDIEAYYQINQDPKVIEFLAGSMTREQVSDFIAKTNKDQQKHRYCFWALELKDAHELIGFVGLRYINFNLPFTPAVEIGWRLGSKYWGKGYASEGAKASLDFGFNKIGLEEIISFTATINKCSMAVMERIGMKRDTNGDFAHPKLAANHPISQHVLYRIENQVYEEV